VSQRLLELLPAIYRQDAFVGRYLKAFEKLLLGIDDGVLLGGVAPPALEAQIDGLASTFDAHGAPKDFLPWLSSWLALSIRADLSESQQRDFLANIAQRYRYRGTLQNLTDLLTLFSAGRPVVTEDAAAHAFTVTIFLPPVNSRARQEQVDRQLKIAHALIELEKPAHTVYTLEVSYPSMQIGLSSRVGVDTILGAANYAAGQPAAAAGAPPSR
jgi:phage tail-like protein